MKKSQRWYKKKWFILCVVTLLTSTTVYTASSYSSASVQGQALVRITEPENALIAAKEIVLSAELGQEPGGMNEDDNYFRFTNNTFSQLVSAELEFDEVILDDKIRITVDLENSNITPGPGSEGYFHLILDVDNDIQNMMEKDTEEYFTTATFNTLWGGGSAEIEVPVTISITKAQQTPGFIDSTNTPIGGSGTLPGGSPENGGELQTQPQGQEGVSESGQSAVPEQDMGTSEDTPVEGIVQEVTLP